MLGPLPKLNVAGSSPVARSIRCPIGGEAAIGSVRRGRPLAAIGGRACGAARFAHRSRRVRSPSRIEVLVISGVFHSVLRVAIPENRVHEHVEWKRVLEDALPGHEVSWIRQACQLATDLIETGSWSEQVDGLAELLRSRAVDRMLGTLAQNEMRVEIDCAVRLDLMDGGTLLPLTLPVTLTRTLSEREVSLELSVYRGVVG